MRILVCTHLLAPLSQLPRCFKFVHVRAISLADKRNADAITLEEARCSFVAGLDKCSDVVIPMPVAVYMVDGFEVRVEPMPKLVKAPLHCKRMNASIYREASNYQAKDEAAEDETWQVAEVLSHRGMAAFGTLEFLTKYVGYWPPTWQPLCDFMSGRLVTNSVLLQYDAIHDVL